MSDFDPYLKWLGIRDPQRPPNHYRLLGLDPFESDIEVISMAADRQMSHVRSYQNGPNGEKSQQLLNELARARRCLLTAESKAKYDQQLRQQFGADADSEDEADDVMLSAGAASKPPVAIKVDSDAKKKRRKREQGGLVWDVVGWIGGGVAALGVGAFLISSGWLTGNREVEKPPFDPAVAQSDPAKNDSTTKKETDENPSNVNSTNSSTASKSIVRNDPGLTDPPPKKNTLLPLDYDDSTTVLLPSPLMPAEGTWTLENKSEYPLDTNSLNRLTQMMADQMSDEGLRVTQSLVSNLSPALYVNSDRGDHTKVLVGLRVWIDDGSLISGVQGIYLHASGVITGKPFGVQTRYFRDMIGRPGFAVCAINVSAEAPVKSIALKYARWTSRGFKMDETYVSDRIGKFGGPLLTLGAPNFDRPIVGLQVSTANFPAANRDDLVSSMAISYVGTPKTQSELAVGPTTTNTPTAATSKKRSAPASSALASSLNKYRQQFASEFKALTNATRPHNKINIARSLAQRLNRQSNQAPSSTDRFAMRTLSMNLFNGVGDLDQAMTNLDLIHDEFEIDYWERGKELIFSTTPTSNDQLQMVLQQLRSLLVRAVEEEEFDVAKDLADFAIKRAVGKSEREMFRKTLADVREIEQLVEESRKAKVTLESSKTDAKANLAMGDYLFLFDSNDGAAFPFWAKSGNSSLIALAELQKTHDENDFSQTLKLGNSWKRLGSGKPTLRRTQAKRIALRLLESAMSQMEEGSKKNKLKKDVEELKNQIREGESIFSSILGSG